MSYYCNECDAPFENPKHAIEDDDVEICVCPYCGSDSWVDLTYAADMAWDMYRERGI